MLGTLILGIAAGWIAPYAEPKVKSALEKVLLDDIPVEPIEMRLIAFESVCSARRYCRWPSQNRTPCRSLSVQPLASLRRV